MADRNPNRPVIGFVEKPEDWKKITHNKTFIKRFNGIEGDQLQRPPKGFSKDAPHLDDLKRKSYFVLQAASEED